MEKLLLPLLLPQLLSQEQQAETALAGSSVCRLGRIRPEERPCLHRSQTPGHSEQPGCDQGRKRRRKGEDVAALPEKFRLFPAVGQLWGFAAEMDPCLGIAPVPGCFQTTGSVGWAGLGRAKLSSTVARLPG